jgi:hypothetical protein
VPPSTGYYSSREDQCPVVVQIHVGTPDDPQYPIIPRGKSGWHAATASRTLLRNQDQRDRTEQLPPSESLDGSLTPTVISGSWGHME